MAMLVLLGAAPLAKAQIVISSTTASTTHTKAEKTKSGRDKGWVIRPELGIGGYGFTFNYHVMGLTGTFEYQFNPYIAIGFGAGLNWYSDFSVEITDFHGIGYSYGNHYLSLDTCDRSNGGLVSIPLYANLRGYFCDRKLSPYYNLKIGYSAPLVKGTFIGTSSEQNYSATYEGDVCLKGIYGSLGLGLQYKSLDFGVSLDWHFFEQGTCKIHEKVYYQGQWFEEDSPFFWKRGKAKLALKVAYNIPFKKK